MSVRVAGPRRSLSHVGGEVRVLGDREAGEKLAVAIDVPSSEASEELARAHVHGFHTYPARMHPLVARRLVEAFSRPGERVLDPFCGSGTVLVEARLAGRLAIGVDANPLAVRLARLKLTPTSVDERATWIEAARGVAAFADERRKARAGATHRYGPADVALFAPHVLLEMDGLRAGIDRMPNGSARPALELVLSAILTKVSRRAGDTASLDPDKRAVEKRIAAGFPSRLLVKKTEELCARLAEVEAAMSARAPTGGPPALALEGDARELAGVRDGEVALAVTSPPYPGNYDYTAHHADRLRWLRLPDGRFDAAEIGARRRLDPLGARAGAARFGDEMGASLKALGRVLAEGRAAVLLLADSVVAGKPVFAVDLVRNVAGRAGFAVRAVASQARPHFHAGTARAFTGRPRGEHAILLTRLTQLSSGASQTHPPAPRHGR